MALFQQPGFVETLCRRFSHSSPSSLAPNLTQNIVRNHEYVALKVFVSKHRQAQNEEKVYKHLRLVKTNHPGVKGIRFCVTNSSS